jgi:selenide,water dikinase
VVLPAGFAAEDRALLTDPQTSGGLLVACDAAALDEVLATFRRHGFEQAAVVGRMGAAGSPRLRVA